MWRALVLVAAGLVVSLALGSPAGATQGRVSPNATFAVTISIDETCSMTVTASWSHADVGSVDLSSGDLTSLKGGEQTYPVKAGQRSLSKTVALSSGSTDGTDPDEFVANARFLNQQGVPISGADPIYADPKYAYCHG